jgi:hypothetical protein
VDFQAADQNNAFIGKLVAPMTARFMIKHGQHRRAAIEEL